MFQNVTVKQLISMLLDCDLNSFVEVHTDNKDNEGRYHAYAFTGVDKKPSMDGFTGEMYTKIKFHNGDFIKVEKTGHWINKFGKEPGYDISGEKTWYIQILCSECGFIKTAIEGHTGQYHYCPNCGAKMIEKEDK